ncbi:MAG TPA: TonB-dependent receptor [Thermoanaerobaculia bacterium]|nr:TonB-dependent receptor [Thermoanaerobaculia bacterium]
MSSRVAALLALLSTNVFAFESRLVDAKGKPVAGAQISVVGQTGSVRTDADGRFAITPDPRLPATLIVIGSAGRIYPPVRIAQFAAAITLEAAFRETVTVTTGAAPNIEAPPAAAPVVVGQEELEQRKPAHVAEAIAATPGIALRGEGPAAVPVVRGLAGGRTLLIVVDARIVAERRAGPSATFLDPFILGAIEISRGPGSVAYGSDAIGGIVHMRPRDPIPGQPDFRYDAWTAFGAENGRSAAVEVSADAFGGAVLASVHARAADDAEDGDGRRIDNSQYRDRGALLRFVRDASWGRMRVGVMTSVARDTGAPSSDAVLTIYPNERATLLTFGLDMTPKRLWSAASVRASLGSYSITTNRVRATGVESAEVKARDASFRVSGERTSERSRLVTGADFVSRFDLRAPGSIEDAAKHDAGLFASFDTRASQSLQLAAGIRGDHIRVRNRGGFFGDRSRRDFALSGHLAATAGPFRNVTATMQLASGYREPVLSDRFFRGVSGRGFVTGNPDLEPERSLQLDAAVRWSGARSTVALFAYGYRIEDLVERYRSGADFFFRNRGEADIRGVELEVSSRLPRDFEWQLGAALARGETETGSYLDDIAPPSLHSSLRWAAERASAFVTLSAYGRDERPGPVEVERAGYASVDAGAGWRIAPKFELRVVVRNLMDAQHFGSSDATAAFAPGRSVTIGVNR